MDPANIQGEKCEFKVYRHSKKKEGKVSVEVLTKPFDQLMVGDKDTPYALVISRYLDEKNQLENTTLQVNSSRLLKVFREVVVSYVTVPADFTIPFTLDSPFQMLLHYWEGLDTRRQTTTDAEERMHLNLLFDFMDHEIGPERDRLLAMVGKNQIKFLSAWCLFRPGDLVYTEFLGHPWILRCEKTAYEESKVDGPFLEVHCVYTDHDGTLEGESKKVSKIFQKKSFAGENPAVITELPIYPRKFVKEGSSLEDRLRERGQKFLGLREVSVQEYDGQAQFLKEPDFEYFHPEMADFPGVWLPYTELGRVILDRKTFQEDQFSNGSSIQSKTPEPLLCPPFEYGFSLSRKEWGRYFVDKIRDVEWREDVWDSLIIHDRQKLVLRSLVTSHTFPEDARDQMKQKGRGLVILLQGTPGSGKTLTAETAAEGSQKALMMTSLGELNKWNSTWSFEYRLKLLLRYATMWRAVVLMDEADVFLEARNNDSSQRNSIVAVFLKELEYFSGIVFLTTNRITSFDRAMKSRVHLALEYNPPELEIRQKIWTQILKSIPLAERDIDPEDAVDTFVGVKMNGREIANSIHTARTIARYEKKPLQMGHVEMVLDVWREFDECLKRTAFKKNPAGEPGARLSIRRTNSIIDEEPDEFRS
ncbi:ATPase AAA-type core [Penicillium hispanicum]|uniref:ATPase AAA-type core n=1 Tax=Penicillium hispanicum TaxID=1080232 RepID=UPI0025406363|nr:ATPase AAA-type core [Penicillium hispanicum]KAJ5587306.1 ATPase AAA-type core [Penicillium hispanicum]